MSVNNNQGAVDVHSLERDTWRTRREAGELDNLVCLVVPPFCDRMTHMLTFFSPEVRRSIAIDKFYPN